MTLEARVDELNTELQEMEIQEVPLAERHNVQKYQSGLSVSWILRSPFGLFGQ
jgi:hypothetical protein